MSEIFTIGVFPMVSVMSARGAFITTGRAGRIVRPPRSEEPENPVEKSDIAMEAAGVVLQRYAIPLCAKYALT